jgi:SnoaL-like domain
MDFKRAAVTVTVALVCTIGPRATFASDKTDVVDAVNRYIANLETDKIQTAVAMCDPEVSILDEFPPHAWHGPTACADWWKALLAYNEKSGITDGEATLGKPWTVDITGNRAYFVAPMTYAYKQNGKSVKESASFTVALKRTQAGWRITSWTYAKQTLEKAVQSECSPDGIHQLRG